MLEGKSGLFIPVPTRVISGPPVSIERVQEWENRSRTKPPIEIARELCELLQDSHHTKLKIKERLAILEFLKPISHKLSQHLSSKDFSGLEDEKIHATLVYEINMEMLNGYKCVVENIEGSLFPYQHSLLSALKDAFHYCMLILLQAFLKHRTPPKGIWLECHNLFLYANQHLLAEKTALKNPQKNNKIRTLNDMYKQCLLLSMSSPFCLNKDDTMNLFYATQMWAPLLSLQDTKVNGFGPFVVDLMKDSGPINSLYQKLPDDCIFLVLKDVNTRLDMLLKAKHTIEQKDKRFKNHLSEQELEVSEEALKKLITLWQAKKVEKKKRIKAQGTVDVCLGINAAHYYLGFASSKNVSQKKAVGQSKADSKQPDNRKTSNLFPSFHCEMVDISQGGFCLRWLEELPPQLRCGEIIAIPKKDKNGEKWSIGTIRWVRTQEDNSTLLGIQTLCENALGVKIRKASSPGCHVPCLLVQENPDHDKLMTLITPHLFEIEDDVEIQSDNVTYTSTLSKYYGETHSYQEFGLAKTNPPFIFK